jgi:subtilisin family serine protease
MNGPPIVGLLDTGLSGHLAGRTLMSRRFWLDQAGRIVDGPTRPDLMGHGTALAELIAERNQSARLLNAQVFDAKGVSAAIVIAAGLRWLVDNGARIVNMSFGLAEDRRVLAKACEDAVRHGVLLVAPVPAMGELAYPAAYPGVIRVTGDGRCHGDDISLIEDGRTRFGADPRLIPISAGRRPPMAGASVAAARVTMRLTRLLLERPAADNAELLERLDESAVVLGPQREHLHAS